MRIILRFIFDYIKFASTSIDFLTNKRKLFKKKQKKRGKLIKRKFNVFCFQFNFLVFKKIKKISNVIICF